MSSLTQMGVSPPGWRLQRHHIQKCGFRSHDMHRHLQSQSAAMSVSWKHAHPTESHTLPSLIALVTGIAKDASRVNHAWETEAGEDGSWEDAKSWTYPASLCDAWPAVCFGSTPSVPHQTLLRSVSPSSFQPPLSHPGYVALCLFRDHHLRSLKATVYRM